MRYPLIILTFCLALTLTITGATLGAVPQLWRLDLGEGEHLEMIWIDTLDLWVSRYEITNGQYRRYDLSHRPTPHFNNALSATRQPAVQISWDDAKNYAGWLNRNFNSQLPKKFLFRLPTSNEWEIFASAGKHRLYVWGDHWPPPPDWNYRGEEGTGMLYGIFENNGCIQGHNDGFIVTAPVEQSGCNDWGIYGVGGNVWEWCADWYDSKRHSRVLRGGGWNNFEKEFLKLSHRACARPEQKNAMVGFRLVLAPSQRRQ